MPGRDRSELESAGAGSRMSRFKKILLSVLVVGALASITVVRVWAAVNADTGNPGLSAASGTLTAKMTLNGVSDSGSPCYSYKNTGVVNMALSSSASTGASSITVGSTPAAMPAGTQLLVYDTSPTAGGHSDLVRLTADVAASGSPVVMSITPNLTHSYASGAYVMTNNANEQGCDAMYATTVLNYPGVAQKAQITITNDGSIDATSMQLWMPIIPGTSVSCQKVDTPGIPAYAHLAGDPCASSNVAGGAGVIFYVQETQSDFTTPVKCWYPSTATTCPLTGSLADFAVNNFDSADYVPMGSGPTHGNSRYFVVGTEFPTNASNTFQGESARFSLDWHLQWSQ